uniref:Uncharacterized protein n=1 Tax=Vespula pensylvanica TaxID=30213 RepID=A0A834UDQ9_VESPE|nr:hypothetical protein H0235_005270 [Vespula pensylvanica]
MVEKRTARGGDDGGSGGDGDGGSSADIELQADYHRARINALPRGNVMSMLLNLLYNKFVIDQTPNDLDDDAFTFLKGRK